mmetsp:Transcript_31325/g.73038  ORF Transcript_31325/g.73038 Transcript_31325/m.73038 type:complete len:285 (-) Transcript_31325:120-974(-)
MVLLEAAIGKAALVAASSPAISLHGWLPTDGDLMAAGSQGLQSLGIQAPFAAPWEHGAAIQSAAAVHGASIFQGFREMAEGVATVTTAVVGHASEALKSNQVVVSMGIGLASAAATVTGLTSCFELLNRDNEDSDEEEAPPRGSFLFVPAAMGVCACVDLYMGGVLLSSLGVPLPVPLRTWTAGTLLLSFPVTALIRKTSERHGFRAAFGLELAAMGTSFVWLAWGTQLLAANPDLVEIVPVLFWSCYTEAVLAWSWLGASVGWMVMLTVMSVLAESVTKMGQR